MNPPQLSFHVSFHPCACLLFVCIYNMVLCFLQLPTGEVFLIRLMVARRCLQFRAIATTGIYIFLLLPLFLPWGRSLGAGFLGKGDVESLSGALSYSAGPLERSPGTGIRAPIVPGLLHPRAPLFSRRRAPWPEDRPASPRQRQAAPTPGWPIPGGALLT